MIPQAPPPLDSLIDPVQIQIYESRKNQILNAKGTLKSPKKDGNPAKSGYQFFLHETESGYETILRSRNPDDSISIASEEDFAGVKNHSIRSTDGNLTIRSHRGNYSFLFMSLYIVSLDIMFL